MANSTSPNLVTGAAGFIGRNLVEELLRRGDPVRAMVRETSPRSDEWSRRGAEVFTGDVRDSAAVAQAVQGAGVVHHCAAAVGPQYSDREIREINVDGVRNVLEALRHAGSGRMVLLSSINVLGNRNLDGESEDLPYQPFGEVRGDVKIEAEKLALDYHRTHGVEVVIIRPAMVYGPGDRNLEKLLRPIRKGKFKFIGSRENVIPVVHVENLVQAMLLAAEKPCATGRIYHIADDAKVTAGELASYLAELTHSPPSQRALPYPLARSVVALFETLQKTGVFKGRPLLTRVSLRFLGTSRHIDIRRAKNELDYHPQIGFREGMAEAVHWLEKNALDDSPLARSPA